MIEGGRDSGGREGRERRKAGERKGGKGLDGEMEGGNGWMEGSRRGQVGGREEGI